MADLKARLSKIAQGFSDALQSDPEDSQCPHCGQAMPKDDISMPKKADADAFAKGMEQQPDYAANIKKGLGL